MTIDGYDVLDIEPDFAQPPQASASRAVDANSGDRGLWAAQWRGKHAQHTLNFQFVLGQSDAESLSEFFYARAGKTGDFLVPSWTPEVVPAAGLASGEASFQISAPADYDSLLLVDEAGETPRLGRYVWLLHVDGTLHVSRVAGVAGDPQILTMETAVTQDFDLGDFICGYLYFVRFLSDELDLEFRDGVASAVVGMVEVVGRVES